MRVYDHFPNPDCKGYKILNIHGYHGSPKNSVYTALHEIGCENIISPSIDYDSEEPSNIIGTLNMLRVQYKADMIIGTSLGGFYAAVLSARHDLPVMLVNPCLTPFLLDILSDFKTRPLVKLFGELAKIDSSRQSRICREVAWQFTLSKNRGWKAFGRYTSTKSIFLRNARLLHEYASIER